MWAGFVAFLTSGFDKFFGWFGLIKKGFEFVVNSRLATTTLIIVLVKTLYDYTIAVLNEVMALMQGADGASDPSSLGGAISGYLAFGNCIFPIAETFQVYVLLLQLWLVCFVVRLKMRFIPKIF